MLPGTDANLSAYNKTLFVVNVPSTTTFKVSATSGGSAISASGTYTANSGVVDTGIYNFTLTGGNITISNNVTYLVPEEIGTINKPIEGVTGARGIGGTFNCYLVFDNATGNTGASADFFADLVDADKGLTKVVNEFDVTFKVGGVVADNHESTSTSRKCTLMYLAITLKTLFHWKQTLVPILKTLIL